MTASFGFSVFNGGQDNITTAGTTQGTATLLTGALNRLTTAASQTGAILPANAAQGGPITVTCLTATTAVLFPPVGGSINGLAVNTGVNVAQNKSAIAYPQANGLDYLVVVGA